MVHYDDGDVCAEDFTDLSKQWKIIECFWPTSHVSIFFLAGTRIRGWGGWVQSAFGGSIGTFRGGWTLDFSECPIDPLGGGGWTLDFSESPTDPLGGGGWTLDFKKERNSVQGGGCYKVTLVLGKPVSAVVGG